MTLDRTSSPRTELAEWRLSHAAGAALLTTLIVWAASALDHGAFHVFYLPEAARHPIARAVKWMGTLTPWLAIALLVLAVDASKTPGPATLSRRLEFAWRRAATLLASGAAGGATAEALKILFRRERPVYHDGLHMLRPISERTLHSGGLDLPSSHVGVAFGMCCAAALLFPSIRHAAMLLAFLVAVVRMLEGSHSLSAVTLGAALGWSCARLFVPLLSRKEPAP